jgi:hypothetical protein
VIPLLSSIEGLKALAWLAKILGFVFAALGVLCGVTNYWADSRAKELEKAPRSVVAPPAVSNADVAVSDTTLPIEKPVIILVSIGDLEVQNFARQIQSLLSIKYEVRFSHIGSQNDAPNGVTYFKANGDVAPALELLTGAQVKAMEVTERPLVPSRIFRDAPGAPVVVVGAKETP